MCMENKVLYDRPKQNEAEAFKDAEERYNLARAYARAAGSPIIAPELGMVVAPPRPRPPIRCYRLHTITEQLTEVSIYGSPGTDVRGLLTFEAFTDKGGRSFDTPGNQAGYHAFLQREDAVRALEATLTHRYWVDWSGGEESEDGVYKTDCRDGERLFFIRPFIVPPDAEIAVGFNTAIAFGGRALCVRASKLEAV